jgi:hypothetical protein
MKLSSHAVRVGGTDRESRRNSSLFYLLRGLGAERESTFTFGRQRESNFTFETS